MKKIIYVLPICFAGIFLCQFATIIWAQFIVPCPMRMPALTSCNHSLPSGFVERYCSSSEARGTSAECTKSVQELSRKWIPYGHTESSNETFVGVIPDNNISVTCATATGCQWENGRCVAKTGLLYFPPSATITLYQSRRCSDGQPVQDNLGL